jgi:hypothetical protein
MEKKLLIFLFFVTGLSSYNQPVVKIFAFEQESSPGTVPAGVKDENGNPVKKAAAKEIYFVFLSFKKTSNIKPVQIFIKGKSFSIEAIEIRKSPVEYTDNTIPNKPEKNILIPQTSNKVVEIKLNNASIAQKKSFSLQKLANLNEVVVSYLWHKKKYFIALKNIKKLNPLVNE